MSATNFDFDKVTTEGCISYLKSWKESLEEKIRNRSKYTLLYEEQILFLSKAISDLENI